MLTLRPRIDAVRALLRFQHQLRRQEAVRLRHRRLRPVDDVVHELLTVRERHVAAIDVLRLLLIDQEQVVGPGAAAEVDVLPDLDEALGAEDRQAPVAPRREAVEGGGRVLIRDFGKPRKPDTDLMRTILRFNADYPLAPLSQGFPTTTSR
jgi:hypothetical protein